MTTYDTAQHQGDRVASSVKEEAQTIAEETKRQTANLLDQAREEVQQQTVTQRDRLVDTLRGFTDDVERMIDGQGAGDGLAADLARQAADRARDLTRSLQDREPGEILDDVRGFARRRPGTFLLGALAAGVVVGRFARGARDDGSSGSSAPTGAAGARGSAGSTNGGRPATAYADPTGVPPARNPDGSPVR